ncbi:hydrogenase formation protein HypD [bacterium]|nr:hydrogenase formation protein HypD [bacterium]
MHRHFAALGRKQVRLMEVCGTHTMAIYRHGLRSLFPAGLELTSGPGCPVCVTPTGVIDAAIRLARIPEVTLCTFGDMLRVPGSTSSLDAERAAGASVRVCYSSLDALDIARAQPDRQVVFAGVGFETTAPTMAATILSAEEENIANFSALVSYKTMPQPMRALLQDQTVSLEGFLCPGHVSVVTGSQIYEFIPAEFGIPCVVAGFEPHEILEGLAMLLSQLAEGRAEVEIQYKAAVVREGNPTARAVMNQVFEPVDAEWRGLGVIAGSGLALRSDYVKYDACARFGVSIPDSPPHPGCSCGDVLRGAMRPEECPLFGAACTPETPFGPCMVSSEGACAAHHKYGVAIT